MKYHPGLSALKVTVLLGALTVLLTGCCSTGRNDYRDKGYVDNNKLHQYDGWDTRDHDRP
jgi:hypothetical protein